MKAWPVQDAKARFSEFLETCLAEGPQLVTRRGSETAVLVPIEQWRHLQAQSRPSLKGLLLAEDARIEFKVPARGRAKRRPPIVND
ncbi:MAG: type II toxin-antitoxin system Phd/YefM family antitoxin [Burkholderiaceae bacterium]|jgi:prevent-host-death family protein